MTESEQQSSQSADALLQKFVMAEHSEDAQLYLDQLLSNHAQPLIIQVIGRKLNSGQIQGIRDELQDGEDICHEVPFQLLRRLRSLRESKEVSAIASFCGYVAITAPERVLPLPAP
jgi:hypothetical protein